MPAPSPLSPAQMGRSEPPDLNQLVTAVNEEVVTSRVVLTGILGLTIAIIATILATNDLAIFRDSIEAFPLFGVKIRVSAAYTLIPVIFVFLHANALLHLRLLIVRLRGLEDRMKQLRLSEANAVMWRRLIRGLPFAQLHSGPDTLSGKDIPARVYGVLLKTVSTIAIAIMPVFLLLSLQVSFVRYQSTYITFLQMACLTFDIAMLLWFGLITWKARGAWWKSALAWSPAVISTLCICGISYFIAVPPDVSEEVNAVWGLARPCCGLQAPEWHPSGAIQNQDSMSRPYSRGLDLICRITNIRQTCRYLDLRNLVLANDNAERAFSSLDTGFRASDLIRSKIMSVAAPYRNFRFARFDGSVLLTPDLRGIDGRKTSFLNAAMRDATLEGADIRWANFEGATLDQSDFSHAQISDASFKNASLVAANFHRAILVGTMLTDANVAGASFYQAIIYFSSFNNANLIGAAFQSADLNASLLQQADLRLAVPPLVCYGTRIKARDENTPPNASREALNLILTRARISEANRLKIEAIAAKSHDFECRERTQELAQDGVRSESDARIVQPTDSDELLSAVGLFLCETHPERVDWEVERFMRNVTSSILWAIKVKEETWVSKEGYGGGPVRPPFQDNEIAVLEAVTRNNACEMVDIADVILSVNSDGCDDSVDRVDPSRKLRSALEAARDKAAMLMHCAGS